MSGSLIQILSKNKKDAFLTFDPQITFFKTIFLQHTPFSIDTIEEQFNKTPNFGEEVFCQMSKYGDLISNIFLKIVLPSVHIKNILDADLLSDYSDTEITYENYTLTIDNMILEYNTKIINFKAFSQSAMIYWRNIKNILNNTTTTYNTIITLIDSMINTQNDVQNIYDKYDDFNDVKVNKSALKFNFSLLTKIKTDYTQYANSIYNDELTVIYKNVILTYLDNYVFFQKEYMKFLLFSRDLFVSHKEKHDTKYYRFAWVKNIAFAIIECITFELGGQVLDRVDSYILNNWYEMSTKIEFVDTLNKMIGNVQILTDYNDTKTPTYTLYIPIPLWFSRYKSQALQCVSTRYQDIILKVKLTELYKCCFFEPDEFGSYVSNININEEIKIKQISLIVDYIHLGDVERTKFSTFIMESLIEQHRILTFPNIQRKTVLLPLDFTNSVKDVFWTIQKKYNVEQMKLWNDYETFDAFPGLINVTGQQEPYINKIFIKLDSTVFNNYLTNFTDYTNGTCEIFHSKYYNGKYKIILANEQVLIINNSNFIYPDTIKFKLYKPTGLEQQIIDLENIMIYGKDLMTLRDPEFFTLVQNRERSKTSLHIHKQSLSLNPEEFQPSGSLNFNVIKNKQLQLIINDTVLEQLIKNNDKLIVRIIGKNYNTLHIDKGYANVVF
jgi:hypothetical protein